MSEVIGNNFMNIIEVNMSIRFKIFIINSFLVNISEFNILELECLNIIKLNYK